MRKKTTIVKRIFLMFLVVWITFISVFGAYQKSVEAAEWVAGTIAAIGGAPILSALLIGGVVVAGGIAVYELSQTSAEDHRNFVDGIKNGFNEFVAEQEKQIALEQDSSLTDQQAADLGVAAARDTINNFTDNAISVTRTTAKNLKTKTVEYWNKYCKDVSSVSDNGVGVSNTTSPSVYNNSNVYFTAETMPNTTDNLVTINGSSYAIRGKVDGIWSDYAPTQDNSSLYKCPFLVVTMYKATSACNFRLMLKYAYVDKNTGEIQSFTGDNMNSNWYNYNDETSAINNLKTFIAATTIPVFVINYDDYSSFMNTGKNNQAVIDNMKIGGQSANIPNWKRTINDTLNDTHMGKAIRSGRRAKLQSGDYIGSTFVDDSIPLKKTALRVGDATTVGKVGWDIPQPDVWDDVFSGGRPFSDVVRDTGVVAVPSDDVSSYPTDTEVEFPTDTDVQDTDDVIDIPSDDEIDIDDEIEIPERPLPDIIEDQEGDFYPTEMDLTQLFPFCIPFDIIYLVEKFDVSGANAPVITLPLKYPAAIRGSMGTDRYVVTIDLADYVVVRDVIRVFLLLLFIAGLMKITRDLIRG